MRGRNFRNSEKGVSLILGTVAMVMIVPMLGLFIDVGILYAAKARLQSSVDGAALAAARALESGTISHPRDHERSTERRQLVLRELPLWKLVDFQYANEYKLGGGDA